MSTSARLAFGNRNQRSSLLEDDVCHLQMSLDLRFFEDTFIGRSDQYAASIMKRVLCIAG